MQVDNGLGSGPIRGRWENTCGQDALSETISRPEEQCDQVLCISGFSFPLTTEDLPEPGSFLIVALRLQP